MDLLPPLADLGWLLLAAFLAGLFDAAVGGGGLIQVPALFAVIPGASPASLLGTNKLASVMGTLTAARHYARELALDTSFLRIAFPLALVGAFIGASLVAWLPVEWARPVILLLLIVMFLRTWLGPKIGLGSVGEARQRSVWVLLLVSLIGFYDGFFGPGTGSFLIFVLVRWFGHDFLNASAHAKVINSGTNIGALVYFALQGHVLWLLGLLMGVGNILGAQIGARVAVRGGAVLVRQLFLLLCVGLILKMGWTLYG